MRVVLLIEIIALLVLPFFMAALRRRQMNIEKVMAVSVATLIGLLMGSFDVYLSEPETVFSLTLEDWIRTIAIASVTWVFAYLFCRWLGRQWFQ